MTVSCSKCQSPVLDFQPEAGVTIGMCRGCKGMWFPKGMLARILRTSGDLDAGLARTPRATKFACRACGAGKFEELDFAPGRSAVKIDRCTACAGVFLDANELMLLKKDVAAQRKNQGHPPGSRFSQSTASKTRNQADGTGLPDTYFVRQRVEMWEVVTDFESRNKYDLVDASGAFIGHVAEANQGVGAWFMRQFLKTHRPMLINVFDMAGNVLLRFHRPFFWFFSDMTVTADRDVVLGHVVRRFAWLTRLYDLRDANGQTFAQLRKPLWRIWKYDVVDGQGRVTAQLTKQWAGVLKELFTSSDTFQVAMDARWTPQRRAVLLAGAITVDMDQFETQTKGGGRGSDPIGAVFDLLSLVDPN